jgi:excisionase family DNA binding protein
MVTQKSKSHLSRQADAAYPNISDKLAYSINEACASTGIGRTSLYELISNGQLKAIKAAGRRLILRTDLEAYLASCRNAAA